jgi:hypothetical protein
MLARTEAVVPLGQQKGRPCAALHREMVASNVMLWVVTGPTPATVET